MRKPAYAEGMEATRCHPLVTGAPITMRRMSQEEVNDLDLALREHARRGVPLKMDPADTSFAGAVELDEGAVQDEMVRAVKSIPTHY